MEMNKMKIIKIVYLLFQPNVGEEKEWIKFLSDSNDETSETLVPTLDVVLAINQPTIENLLEHLIDSVVEQEIIQFHIGRWIYVLLVALELPVNPDICSCLRSLARVCSVIRASEVIIVLSLKILRF